MRSMKIDLQPWVCLVAAGGLVLAGCGDKSSSKGDKSKNSPAMGAVMGAASGGMSGGMGAGPARVRARPGQAAGPAAGVQVWPVKWPKSLRPLYKTFVKAAKKKDYKVALATLEQMRNQQPSLLSLDYKSAYLMALSGDAAGALVLLKKLLHASYPKYSFKVATDKDLDSLKQAPHKAKLDKLVEEARLAHVAAWKKAAFFIGANLRAFKYKRGIRGTQEIYGYVPDTGRIVAVTYVAAANTLGYLVTPDRSAMIYVAASKFVSDEGEPRFSDVEVHALSLTTGKRLKVFATYSHPGGGFHGQTDVAKTAKPREHKEEDPGVVEVKLVQLKKGAYRLMMMSSGPMSPGDPKEQTWHFTVSGDAVTDAPQAAKLKSRILNELRVRMCGAKARRRQYARKLKKDGDSFEIGGKQVTFACAGLIWRTPDNTRAVFQPYRYCKKHASKLDGLYVVDAAGKFTRVTPKHDTWDLKWTGNRHALVQFGGQVGYVDVVKPRFQLLGPVAAHLRAFGPRAIKKCTD